MKIKIIAALSTFAIFAGIYASAQYSPDALPDRLDDAAKWSEEYFDPALNPQFEGSSYQIMAMARMGRKYDYSSYLRNIEDLTAGYTEYTSASDYALASLAISSAGGDPRNADGRDLLAEGIYNRTESSPLLSGTADDISLSLIALDSKDYDIPEGAAATRETMISALLGAQQSDGGFSNVRSTALALSALSKYVGSYVSPDVINSAVDYLSAAQNDNGDFGDLESTAAVLMALDAVGVNSDDDMRFIKNNKNVTDGLLNYSAPDGSFYAYGDGTGEATGIAACAMTSHVRYLDSNSDFFSFNSTDMPQSMDKFNNPDSGQNNLTSGNNAGTNNNNNSNSNNNNNNNDNSSNNSNNNNSSSTNNGNNEERAPVNTQNNGGEDDEEDENTDRGSDSSRNNTNSSSVAAVTPRPARTAAPSVRVTPRPAATMMPRVTIAPRATIAPRPSSVPSTSTMRPIRTPKPTKEPELVGPVKLPGPMPTQTPSLDDDEMSGMSEQSGIDVPIAAGIIAAFALAAVIMVYLASRKKTGAKNTKKPEKPAPKTEKTTVQSRARKDIDEIYHAKIHRRTEIHGAYRAREKYKERGKYKGSYRK